ncbi:unnamed protein product [Paramecium pentaurelia]|uniref:Protein kinase domain-containing protein n=1 Tax=Paramecium pentaurelia TaxID=43138 RepID=A0A8S1T207_9CILI|nr:unnamed protein product [Paramecium pentaurelia]
MSSSSSSSSSRSSSRSSSSSSSSSSRYSHKKQQRRKNKKKEDQDAGHFEYQIGMKIKAGQFVITRFLGDGTFGRVLEVKTCNTTNNNYYAMKCIRAVERYIESAKIETKILWYIQDKDKSGAFNIVRLFTSFERYENYFMVFERLGKSLYDIIKQNNYIGFPMKYVQSFAKQIITSVAFLHQNQITHTDLKPENILTTNCEYKLIPFKGKQIWVPEREIVKIIDLGGATFDYEYHSTIINTRQYRAPEVIMGYPKWNEYSDIWCIACVLLELYTGELYFQNKDDLEHIAMIEKAIGPMDQRHFKNSKYKTFFNYDQKYFDQHRSYFKWNSVAPSDSAIERVKKLKTFEELIPAKHALFIDLIRKMLRLDPEERIPLKRLIHHQFFQQVFQD